MQTNHFQKEGKESDNWVQLNRINDDLEHLFILLSIIFENQVLALNKYIWNPVFASLFWNIMYLSMFSYLFLFCVFYGSSGYTGKDKRFNIGQVEGI